MDKQLIEQKLELLRRCVDRIQKKCPESPLALSNDLDLQDIIAINLSRAVQLSVDIGSHLIAVTDLPTPSTMGQTFDLLKQAGIIDAELSDHLKKAVGFRNIAVHQYEEINWQIVHRIANSHLIDFRSFAASISAYLEQ